MDNNDLIRRGATAKDLRAYAERKAQVNGIEYANGILAAACRIEQSIPAVDAVERGVFEQVTWERDIAVKQLADIGKSLGEKMDDVTKVVRCPKCRHSDFGGTYCKLDKDEVHPSYFCGRGQRREEERNAAD